MQTFSHLFPSGYCARWNNQNQIAAPLKAVDLDKAPATIAGIIRVVAGAREGERNQLCFWGACRLAELAAQQIIDRRRCSSP